MNTLFISNTCRFVEIHREHAEGTLYQYMNKHVNDNYQVTYHIFLVTLYVF